MSENGKTQLNEWILSHKYIFILALIIILSISLDLFALLRYELSYGPDGPYYDIQIRYILQTGFPESNDAPMIYYLLTPFVLITGDSFLGIKIGMSVICSLMAIPAFLIAETISKKFEINSKIPSFICALLMIINVYYFRMIQDFMQNLVGAFFLLWLFYFAARWLEDFMKWQVNGTLTVILLACNILTHTYTAGIAIAIMGALIGFYILMKWIKTKKMPKLEFKIIGLLGIIVIVAVIILIFVFPTIYENFYSRVSGYVSELLSSENLDSIKLKQIFQNAKAIITIPFFIGLYCAIEIIFKDIKNSRDIDYLEGKHGDYEQKNGEPVIDKGILLSWIVIALSALIAFLIIIPSSWQTRFVLLSFLPISLTSMLCLKKIELIINKAKEISLKNKRNVIITALALTFCGFSIFNVVAFIPTMGPSITMDQYNELQYIQENYSNQINETGIIHAESFEFAYWVEYALNRNINYGNMEFNSTSYQDQAIYEIIKTKPVESPFKAIFDYPWFPLFPMSLPNAPGDNIMNFDPHSAAEPPPMGPKGLIIFEGEYIALILVKWDNGTIIM